MVASPAAANSATAGASPAAGALPAGTLRIGRQPDNDIVVSDPGVSRHHAELRDVAGACRIVDLDSANGTFVNGQRVTAAPLSEGDIVGIGPATFRLAGQELRKVSDTAADAVADAARRPAAAPPGAAAATAR